MATLPVAIFVSRIGVDCCYTPLFSMVLIYQAFRTDRRGLAVAFLLCFIAHPTNVFLLPIVAPVALWQAYRSPGEGRVV